MNTFDKRAEKYKADPLLKLMLDVRAGAKGEQAWMEEKMTKMCKKYMLQLKRKGQIK